MVDDQDTQTSPNAPKRAKDTIYDSHEARRSLHPPINTLPQGKDSQAEEIDELQSSQNTPPPEPSGEYLSEGIESPEQHGGAADMLEDEEEDEDNENQEEEEDGAHRSKVDHKGKGIERGSQMQQSTQTGIDSDDDQVCVSLL
jgi:hypothetical protein